MMELLPTPRKKKVIKMAPDFKFTSTDEIWKKPSAPNFSQILRDHMNKQEYGYC